MKKGNLIFILVSLCSHYNLGSIFRTADALDTEKIYLTGFTGTPKQSKVKKTALGAEENIAWEKVTSTSKVIEELRSQGYQIIGLEKTTNSQDFRKWKPTRKTAILLGNEERGLSPRILKQCDKVIHLSMEGIKESLNVSVAAGAIGYYIKAVNSEQ